MNYRRMPIELESPEEFGYGNIKYNLAESSVTDGMLRDLKIDLTELTLFYGDHRGKLGLREIIAADGDRIRPGHVLVTVGAAHALFIVHTSLLDRGDHAVVVHPNYATNVETPRAIGADVEYLRLSFEDAWRIDIDRLEAMMQRETKLVSLTVPHNPTGVVITEEDLHRVVELAETNDCYLLLDETYRDLTYGEPLPVAASLSRRAVSVSSISKSYGFPGLRCGWIICRDEVLYDMFLAAKEQMLICGPVIDEEVALSVLKSKNAFLEKFQPTIREGVASVEKWINNTDSMEWISPAGGVVCFPRIKPEIPVDIDRFYRVLQDEYGTFVGPGHWFEMDRRFMRIRFGWAPLDDLRAGLQSISSAVSDAML